MKISEIPTSDLRRMLAATERTLGKGTVEVRILRRELARRVAAQPARGGAAR